MMDVLAIIGCIRGLSVPKLAAGELAENRIQMSSIYAIYSLCVSMSLRVKLGLSMSRASRRKFGLREVRCQMFK